MSATKLILNPVAGRGRGARVTPLIQRILAEKGLAFDLIQTQRKGHATELARQAALDGAQLVVAVGGDGTSNEVVNGLMQAAGGRTTTTMSAIPVGSGSDFAHAIGMPADLQSACLRLIEGERRLVDVGRVQLDGEPPRYFDNTVGVGFDAIVTYEAQKVKRLRGMALYLPVVLKTVFLYGKSPDITVAFDGKTVRMPAMMVCVGNGSREGGGFFVTPDAEIDDGVFDLCVVRELGRLATLKLIPSFMNGTHVGREPVTMAQATHITISSPDALIAHVDGEMLCTDGHRLDIEVLPGLLSVLS